MVCRRVCFKRNNRKVHNLNNTQLQQTLTKHMLPMQTRLQNKPFKDIMPGLLYSKQLQQMCEWSMYIM